MRVAACVSVACPARPDAFGVRVDLPIDAVRAFRCDHVLVQQPGGDALLIAVYDAQPFPGDDGWACVGGVPLGRVAEAAGDRAARTGLLDTDSISWLPSTRSVQPASSTVDGGADRLLELQAHWDQRYATPGREPLTTPLPGLARWLERWPGRPLLVLGDGEGRNAIAAAAGGRPVRMMELSTVGADTCRRLNDSPSLLVATGDFVRWMRHGRPLAEELVAASYVGPFTADEWGVVTGFLARVVEQGGGFYWEAARAGLDEAQQSGLCRLGRTECVEFRRDADDVQRIRVSSVP